MKKPSQYREEIRQALANPNLRTALFRGTSAFRAVRSLVVQGFDFESYRDQVLRIKEESIERSSEVVRAFRENAERMGAIVHEAKDSADANRYIQQVAERHGVKLVVKSKSMATEEIGLNSHLESCGMRVVETDLGEWIIQLANERPSHFLAPAIHKTREEVAELFSRLTGQEIPADIEKLVKVARRELRQYFIDADMGITGANIAIAETGTLVIVTNEGNERLAATLPPVHVAVLGYEKIVPTMEDATLVLKLLLRSAGTPMSSYVSYITGPSRTADIELTPAIGVHGPEELHIVLLDNGRSALRDEPAFREALYCLKCAACLNVCPVFQTVGGHLFGHIYTGGIGTVLTSFLHGLEHASNSLQVCIGCHSCTELCPVEIDTPRMILSLRQREVEQKGLPWAKGVAFRRIMKDRDLFHQTLLAAAAAQRSAIGRAIVRHLPLFFSSLTRLGALPAIAEQPLRKKVERLEAPAGENRRKVAFFSGCLIDFAYPECGEAVMATLEEHDLEVVFPQEQTCCGIPAIYGGDRETAEELARQNIAALEAVGADFIVTACPTCSVALRENFIGLTSNEEVWQEKARAIAESVFDFSEFLMKVLNVTASAGQEVVPEVKDVGKVTYHDSCHLKWKGGMFEEPRQILKARGYDIQEMNEPDRCCGFGGTFSLIHPELADAILDRKLEAIQDTGAAIVAADCPGCVMQLRRGLQKRKQSTRVLHSAELIRKSTSEG